MSRLLRPVGSELFASARYVMPSLSFACHEDEDHNSLTHLVYREMAVGNTFGATALSSYGGFWISYAILLTPGFAALDKYSAKDESSVLGFFLMGWFIFTFILLMCTLRSTVMFFLLFFTLDLAFLFLGTADLAKSNGATQAGKGLQVAGGVFGLFAAFLAWYNAFAGIADTSNSFFLIPVFHFPWSEKGRETRGKTARETV